MCQQARHHKYRHLSWHRLQHGTGGRREEGPREAFRRLCSLSWVPTKKWSLTPVTLPHANGITTSESLLWFSWDLTCLLRLPWLWRVIKRLSGSAYHRISATFRVHASPGRCILRNSQKDQASWRQAAPTGSAWLAAFPPEHWWELIFWMISWSDSAGPTGT